MAISAQRIQIKYIGNDTAETFPFPFQVFHETEVKVTHTTSSGQERVLKLGVDYHVTLSPQGGSVKLRKPLAQGDHLLLTSQVPFDQPMVFSAQSTLKPLMVERALDRVTIQIQQVRDSLAKQQGLDSFDWEASLQARLQALKAEIERQIPAAPPIVPLAPLQSALEKALLQLLDQIQEQIDQGKEALETQRDEIQATLQRQQAQIEKQLDERKALLELLQAQAKLKIEGQESASLNALAQASDEAQRTLGVKTTESLQTQQARLNTEAEHQLDRLTQKEAAVITVLMQANMQAEAFGQTTQTTLTDSEAKLQTLTHTLETLTQSVQTLKQHLSMQLAS